MKFVFGYRLSGYPITELNIPVGSEILYIGATKREGYVYPYLCVMMDSEAPMERRTFYTRGTVNDFDKPEESKIIDEALNLKYVGSVSTTNDTYHIFEKIE